MFLINKKTGLLVRGVRMLHSHSVDEGAFDREGRLLTFKIDVHDEEGTLIGYTDSEGTTAKQRTRSLSVHLRNIGPTGKVAEPGPRHARGVQDDGSTAVTRGSSIRSTRRGTNRRR
jgi:hypothetical protein